MVVVMMVVVSSSSSDHGGGDGCTGGGSSNSLGCKQSEEEFGIAKEMQQTQNVDIPF